MQLICVLIWQGQSGVWLISPYTYKYITYTHRFIVLHCVQIPLPLGWPSRCGWLQAGLLQHICWPQENIILSFYTLADGSYKLFTKYDHEIMNGYVFLDRTTISYRNSTKRTLCINNFFVIQASCIKGYLIFGYIVFSVVLRFLCISQFVDSIIELQPEQINWPNVAIAWAWMSTERSNKKGMHDGQMPCKSLRYAKSRNHLRNLCACFDASL